MNDRSNDPQIPSDGSIPAPLSARQPLHAERMRADEQPTLARPVKRGRPWVWLIVLLALVAAAFAAWWWSGGNSSAAPEQAKGKGRGDASARPMPVVAV